MCVCLCVSCGNCKKAKVPSLPLNVPQTTYANGTFLPCHRTTRRMASPRRICRSSSKSRRISPARTPTPTRPRSSAPLASPPSPACAAAEGISNLCHQQRRMASSSLRLAHCGSRNKISGGRNAATPGYVLITEKCSVARERPFPLAAVAPR